MSREFQIRITKARKYERTKNNTGEELTPLIPPRHSFVVWLFRTFVSLYLLRQQIP